jgi:hypothetical protein
MKNVRIVTLHYKSRNEIVQIANHRIQRKIKDQLKTRMMNLNHILSAHIVIIHLTIQSKHTKRADSPANLMFAENGDK